MDFKFGSYGYIATKDLEHAEVLVSTLPDLSLFSMQQAIEKIMKQIIVQIYDGDNKQELLKTHNLQFLANHIKFLGTEEYHEFLEYLSEFYSKGRYPGIDFVVPTVEEASNALPKAREYFDLMLGVLNAKEMFIKFERFESCEKP